MTSCTGHGAGNRATGGCPSNTSLREKKKAETKEAIARAAAHVLLRDGAEALTVAHVAQAAGVSPRTFHNYFQSMEEALLWFIHLHGAEITEAFAQVPAEYSVVEAARAVFVVGSDAGAGTVTGTGTGEQSSMVALMHVVQQVAAMPNISAAKYAFEENYGNTSPHLLADALAARMPDADQFTIHTYDWLIGAAIASAVDEYTAARSSTRSRDVGSSGVSDSDSEATEATEATEAVGEKTRPELNSLLNSAFDTLKLIS
ncbi:TetR/AcrR family transcriptional regulator [Corynebacterium propinquum]